MRRGKAKSLLPGTQEFGYIQALNDAVVIFDPMGRVVFVNPVFERKTGLSKNRLVGKDGEYLIEKTIALEDQRVVLKVLADGRRGVKIKPIFVNFVKKDKRKIPIHLSISYLRDRKGKPVQVITVIRDVSEIITQAKEELKHLRKLVEERTKEVRDTNRQLEREILARRQAEQKLERWKGEYRKTLACLSKSRSREKSQGGEMLESWLEFAESLPLPVYEMDLTGRITYANKPAFKAFGYTTRDLARGVDFLQVIVPEDRERVLANRARILKEKVTFGNEYTALRKDGSTFSALIYTLPVEKNRKVVSLRGIVVDISRRKQVEKELQKMSQELEERVRRRTSELEKAKEDLEIEIEARKQLEEVIRENERERSLILNAMSSAVLFLDKDLRVVWANRVVLEMSGLSPVGVVGKYCYQVLQNRNESCGSCPVKESMVAHAPRSGEVVFPDGRIFLVVGQPVVHPVSGLEGAVSVATDITERKQAENLVRSQSELLLKLEAVKTLDEALRAFLNTALSVSGLETGGIYLVDETTGALDFVCHEGFRTEEFVKLVSHYEPDSEHTRLVMRGEPLYIRHWKLPVPLDNVRLDEGLKALAIIPVKHEGKVIACLNVASYNRTEIPESSRRALEAIAFYMGRAIVEVRLREKIRKSEEMLRFIIGNLGEAVYVIDSQGILTYVNSAAEKVLGYSPSEIIGRSFREFTLTEEYEKVEKRLVSDETTTTSYYLRTKNGEIVEVSCWSHPFYKDGKLVGRFGILRKTGVSR